MKFKNIAVRVSNTVLASVFAITSMLTVLTPGIVHAAAHDCAWTGAGDGSTFGDASNWTSCNSTFPQNGDNLVFDNTSLTNDAAIDDDLSNLSVGSITFQGSGAYGFAFAQNAFTVTGGITNIMSSCTSGSCYEIFNNDITFSGAQSLTVSEGTFITFTGALSGAGLLTVAGSHDGGVWLKGDNSSLSGGISSSAASVTATTATALGTGTTTITGTAILYIDVNTDTTFNTPLSLGGTGDLSTGALYLSMDLNNPGGDGAVVTLAGPVALTSDINVGAFGGRTVKITGDLSGNFAITPLEGDSNAIINIASTNNTSKTASGVLPITVDSSDHQASTGFTAYTGITYILDGIRGDGTVESGSTLKGSGTAGKLTVNSGGIVAPGHSPGCLNSGNLTLNGTYQAEIGGTTACTGYDQLNVTGTVDITGSTLAASLYNSYKPKGGETYTIINNDGNDAVTGTFTGLAEGATFKLGEDVLTISYKGGDGNDVVLTVKSVPAAAPDTGFAFIGSNPVLTLAVTILASAGIIFAARRGNKALSTIR